MFLVATFIFARRPRKVSKAIRNSFSNLFWISIINNVTLHAEVSLLHGF